MKFIWFVFSLIIVEIVCSKLHDGKGKKRTIRIHAKKIHPNVKVPRFLIPNPEGDSNPPPLVENDFSPEAITITKQTGNIKETELPGAFGEDDALRELFEESGSSEDSSGDNSSNRRHRRAKPKHSVVAENRDNHAESAANFGSHLPVMESMNPSSAFGTADQNLKGISAGDDIRRKQYGKKTKPTEKLIKDILETELTLKVNNTQSNKIWSYKNDSIQNEREINNNDNNKKNLKKMIKTSRLTIDDESGVDNNQDENDKSSSSVYQFTQHLNETDNKIATYDVNPLNVTVEPNFLNITQTVVNYTEPQYYFTNLPSNTTRGTIQPNITSFNKTDEPKKTTKVSHNAHKNNMNKKTNSYQSDRDLYNTIQSIQQEIKEVEQKASSQRKKMSKNETKSYHKIRHQVDKQMKKIQKDLRKFKKLKKKSTKSKINTKSFTDEFLRNNSYGGVGEPKGFECPWACMWACHSYCPKECCNNPYNCELICREVCSPTCNDKCCAPGTRRLPRLQLKFKAEAGHEQSNSTNEINQTVLALPNTEQLETLRKTNKTELAFTNNDQLDPLNKINQSELALKSNDPLDPLNTANKTGLALGNNEQLEKLKKMNQTELADKLKVIETAQQYASQLLGLPASCPLFCNRVCAPAICRSECCHPNPSPLIDLLYSGNKHLSDDMNHQVQNITETSPAQKFATSSTTIDPNPVDNMREYFTPTPTSQPVLTIFQEKMDIKENVIQPYINGTSKDQVTEAPLTQLNNITVPNSPSYSGYEQARVQSDIKETPQYTQLQNEAAYQNELKQQDYADYAQASESLENENRMTNEVSDVQSLQALVTPQPLSKPDVAALPYPSQLQAEYPAYPSPSQSLYVENVNDNLIPQPKLEEAGDARDARPYGKLPTCMNDNSCPDDSNRDPDYCPPICRTSCIDQCPNECCTSHNIESQPDKTK